MSLLQKFNIDQLAVGFAAIIQLFGEIQIRKTEIAEKLNYLKEIYNKLIKENNKKIFLFCLDSFYFQYKVLTIEMDNINRFVSLINNRMYGDYYKLYHIIILQCGQFNIDTREISADSKKYPNYRDLEPFHEYDLEHIVGLHGDILTVLTQLFVHYSNKEQSITGYNDTANVGISIVNFIHTLEYENTLLREQVSLYVGYVAFFHNSHSAYLTKLSSKIHVFYREIEDDILNNNSKMSGNTIRLNTAANFGSFHSTHLDAADPLSNHGLYNVLQSIPFSFPSMNISLPSTNISLISNSRSTNSNSIIPPKSVVELENIIMTIQTPLEGIIQDAENLVNQGDTLISKISTIQNTETDTDTDTNADTDTNTETKTKTKTNAKTNAKTNNTPIVTN